MLRGALTHKKISTVTSSLSSHEAGCSIRMAGVGVVFRALAHVMSECKGQGLSGAVGVEREAGAAAKVDLSK